MNLCFDFLNPGFLWYSDHLVLSYGFLELFSTDIVPGSDIIQTMIMVDYREFIHVLLPFGILEIYDHGGDCCLNNVQTISGHLILSLIMEISQNRTCYCGDFLCKYHVESFDELKRHNSHNARQMEYSISSGPHS